MARASQLHSHILGKAWKDLLQSPRLCGFVVLGFHAFITLGATRPLVGAPGKLRPGSKDQSNFRLMPASSESAHSRRQMEPVWQPSICECVCGVRTNAWAQEILLGS